ncbi:hypothetical protein FHS78_003040 [Parvibaculum indicum]|uniref:hypothetical protein n=1 Tax=Parvibaculum indicum TaxID=562969 RepID=UPI00141E9238|nr:hypothetical protein [Parvibaculum indicum]NIJ42735.1 hypothetical protein [Parvibaculum indicum]
MFTFMLDGFARRTRTATVLAALATYLGLAFHDQPPDDALETLFVLMPALEVGFVAGLFALAFDEDADPMPVAATRFLGWLVVVLAAIWLTNLLARASVDAYVRLGGPPIYEAPL